MKKKKAFTLSEVLVTLVIIGVVAALTLPSVMQDTRGKEYAVKLQKANSVLAQSFNMMSKNSGYGNGNYKFLSDPNFNFLDEFAKTVNVAKRCNNESGCFASSYKTLANGTNEVTGAKDSLITTDGMAYNFISGGTREGLSAEDQAKCIGRIAVDVNSVAEPNMFGIDTFFFAVVKGKGIVPLGKDTPDECSDTKSGISCTYRALIEGEENY